MRRTIVSSLCSLFLLAPLAISVRAGQQKAALSGPGANEAGLVTLRGNTRPEAIATNDRGPVVDDYRLEHMMLLLRRSSEQEHALEQFIDQLTDPNSPNYHQWLTAQQFGERYGLAQQDLDAITQWLESYGFAVNGVYSNGVLIDFSGTVRQVREAFHTEIHHLLVNDEEHIANMSDPRIPAALAPKIVGVVSLNDFMPHPTVQQRPLYTFSAICGLASGCYAVVPADLATIYNLNPVFAAGYSGQGQTVVVMEDTDVYSTGDWGTFRSTFGLSAAYPAGSFTEVNPPPRWANNCDDPGPVPAHEAEAILDAEWASAAAPSAAIELASCQDSTTSGIFIGLQNLLDFGPSPAVVSISYGDAETDLGMTFNAAINATYQQAAAEGTSVFVSSGDQGAAGYDGIPTPTYATHGINVNGLASTPYNVAMGGTDFGDTLAHLNATYWSATNSSTYGSALSYIMEIPWNSSCASSLISTFEGFPQPYGTSGFCNSTRGETTTYLNNIAGSGGPSGCATGAPSTTGVVSGTCAGYPKPSWQSVLGNPSDNVRDIPDVSLFAANGAWGHFYIYCWSDTSNGGASCAGAPDTWSAAGGTSFAAPIMAGIQSLINQATASRAGNPNPSYYALAAAEYGASGNASCNSSLGNGAASTCVFYDVTQGDDDVPCQGSYNCYFPLPPNSGTYGVLSTSNSAYQPAYGTNVGWDFATGIGTVNAYNLVETLSMAPAVSFSPPSVFLGAEPVGTDSSPQTVTLTNMGNAALTLSTPTIAGGNAEDFSFNSNCTSTLAAGNSCTLNIYFDPTATGPRKSLLSVSDNAAGSPQTVLLTGVGTTATVSPAALTFASQTVGTSSSPQTATITNTTGGTMNIWEIAILGVDAGDFSKTTTCGSTLAAGASCMVSVTFTPTAAGTRTASLLFSDDAGGSPQAVSLMGTGM